MARATASRTRRRCPPATRTTSSVSAGPTKRCGASAPSLATSSTSEQTVSTPEGFQLGDTVQRLLAVYGSRAHYVAAPPSGMTTNAGYVVDETDGNLAFAVDPATQRIFEIAGGGTDIGPNSCTG